MRNDLTGKVFSRLTALDCVAKNRHGAKIWNCRCECGNLIEVIAHDLKSGHTRSCGCLKLELIRNNRYAISHGACGHSLFHTWARMIDRCYNHNSLWYSRYGGRGIKVCKRWKNDPWKFFEDMGVRPPGLTLERIDNNKGYSPENCRWASRKEQSRNRSSCRPLTFNGKTQLLSAWAIELGIKDGTIRDRLDNRGWSTEKALTEPVRRKAK